MTWIGVFWKFSAQRTYCYAIAILIIMCTLPGLVYNTCQLELAVILMLENANERQHFEACLYFLASKCLLTQIRLK